LLKIALGIYFEIPKTLENKKNGEKCQKMKNKNKNQTTSEPKLKPWAYFTVTCD